MQTHLREVVAPPMLFIAGFRRPRRSTTHVAPCRIGSPCADLAEKVIEAGWAEFHTLVGRELLPPLVIMLYGPRDETEFAICASITEEAYLANGGAHHDSAGRTLGLSENEPGPVDAAHIHTQRPR